MATVRPICNKCNKNFCAINYKKLGITHYRSICDECGRKRKKLSPFIPTWEKAGYIKKNICDLCGFKSLYSTQMTVYHIDGNLLNSEFINLRTICLNCVEVIKKKQPNWKRGDLQINY